MREARPLTRHGSQDRPIVTGICSQFELRDSTNATDYHPLLVSLYNFELFCGVRSVDDRQHAAENWSKPVERFCVIDNIYYVGAAGISSHIIETTEGLILLDTGTTTMFESIQSNLKQLGFEPADVKIIISSHAHWDHVEGHYAMQKLTGAKVMAVGEDARAIMEGVDNSALGGDGWEQTPIDRVLKNGDSVTLGNVTMHAHLTAGHSKGCTTWTMKVGDGDQAKLVVFVGGTSINAGVKLLENERHSTIADDYRRTFQLLKSIQADVFLAQHPSIYRMKEKRAAMSEAKTNPFIDPDGYQKFVAGEEQKYVVQLQKESAEQP